MARNDKGAPGKAGEAVAMTLVRSILYGYLGAILGGLAVAVIAMPLDASLETVAGAASVTGVVLGLLGLMLPWRQAAVAAAGRRRP